MSVYYYSIGQYNFIYSLNLSVESQWVEVLTYYNRRADLIPNLVGTARGYVEQDKAVLLGVTEARASVGKMTVTKEVLESPELFNKFQAAQDQLSSALHRLLVLMEKYPQLKSNESFLALQDELERTEHRVTLARVRFNEAVKQYNTARGRLPSLLIANATGFREKMYFRTKSERVENDQ